MPGPFGQIIPMVADPRAVEDMAGGLEGIRDPGVVPEIEQCGEGQPHPAPFIGNGGAASPAADLAGQDAFGPVLLAVEKAQMIDAGDKPHVALVEDGGPLHGGAMQFLACRAVTDLRIHGIGAHFVYGRPAEAGRPVSGNKGGIVRGRVFGSEPVFNVRHLEPR